MLKLYSTLDDSNVINKTLVHLKDFNIKFKETISIINPSINIKIKDSFDITKCNYCYVEELKRYYFIQDIQILNDDVYRLLLDCDVLETYKDSILNSLCFYERKITAGDYMNVSPDVDIRKDIDIYESGVSLQLVKNIIVSTIGGSE